MFNEDGTLMDEEPISVFVLPLPQELKFLLILSPDSAFNLLLLLFQTRQHDSLFHKLGNMRVSRCGLSLNFV